jgi:lysozyme family protein
MALFETSIEHTLGEEGGFVHFPATGEYANYGITHWLLRDIGLLPRADRTVPANPNEIEFVKSLPLSTAKGIYWAHFWKPSLLDGMNDQPIADKTFDLQVNTGQGIRILQQAVNWFLDADAKLAPADVQHLLPGHPIARMATDDVMGAITLRAANYIAQDRAPQLLAEVRIAAEAHYRAIAAARPVLASNLPSWLARLAR